MSTILDIAGTDKNISHFTNALKTADLETSLKGNGPFTMLAPVNLAFGKLSSPDTLDELLKSSGENKKLADFLSSHILTGKRMAKDFRDGQKLQTINGKELLVTIIEGTIRINGARILSKDRQGFNGVVHTIDAVNIPVAEAV
jgi:uncharacterized surface protein with fasciclin (FAS1) repeats